MKAFSQNQGILGKLWNSPTFTTWGSFLSKSLYAVLVLPIVTTKFDEQDITIWLMLNIFIGFQGIADLGFIPTFVRAISFGIGGAKRIDTLKAGEVPERIEGSNWPLVDKIYGTTSRLFWNVSLVFTLLFIIVGYISMRKPISLSHDTLYSWLSFAVVVIGTHASIYGNKYNVFLLGVYKIAQLRRWETFFSILSTIVILSILPFAESIFYLILIQQGFTILTVFRNRMLTKQFEHGIVKTFKQKGIDKETLKSLFPAAWRSWIGSLMSYGLIQASGILVGQSSNSAATSSYLFTLKLIDFIKNISNAPFYSKIPRLSRLYAENERALLFSVSKQGIRYSLLLYVLGCFGLILLGNPLLKLIHSKVLLVEGPIMLTMVVAFYLERYGAVHIQLYSLSNNIISHIANGVSGILYIGATILLLYATNNSIISYPLGILIGNVLFYTWFSVYKSYQFYRLKPSFEVQTALVSHVLILIYILFETLR